MVRWMIDPKWERIWRKQSWPKRGYYPGTCLEELNKTTKISARIAAESRLSFVHRASLECVSRALTLSLPVRWPECESLVHADDLRKLHTYIHTTENVSSSQYLIISRLKKRVSTSEKRQSWQTCSEVDTYMRTHTHTHTHTLFRLSTHLLVGMLCLSWGVISPLPNQQLEEQPVVGCVTAFNIPCSLFLSGLLRLQLEDAPCFGDKGPT
jgi:hypothetical protein